MEKDILEILKIMPHRYPFLLLDRILVFTEDEVIGLKNVTINEPFFQGHFPNKPVMPGVLLLEAMAQVGGVSLLYPDENRGKIAYFAGMEGVKFRKPVVPGDQVRMEAEVTRLRGSVGKVRAEAFVEGQLVAEAEFMFALSDKQE